MGLISINTLICKSVWFLRVTHPGPSLISRPTEMTMTTLVSSHLFLCSLNIFFIKTLLNSSYCTLYCILNTNMYIRNALLIRLLKILRQPTTGFAFLGAHQVGASQPGDSAGFRVSLSQKPN
ncbi:hypothetical protein CSKR_106056 [Clonorchis sinensis]|uniref:Uncharacterized protein n=1 Tax=Clonorchis sinensis TaxID=79923 RepID=A0A3R7H6N9_CLOSI|nr:hypothetical protein CSKR_106056 [Clonorchis sinensis]